MELASSDEFGGLCTGTGTSPEADALWEQYRRHRQDVTFTELAKDNPLITAGVIVPEYAFLCTKKRALLTELEQSGKIANVEGTKDISSTIADSEDDEEVDEQLKKLLDCDEQEWSAQRDAQEEGPGRYRGELPTEFTVPSL